MGEGIQVCSNEGLCHIQKGDNYEKAKKTIQKLKKKKPST